MAVPILVPCPHCQAKLELQLPSEKLRSKKLLGKRLLCPKCKTLFFLKTHPDIDELSQTQIPSSVERSSKPPTSPSGSLESLSGKLVPLVPLDVEEQAEESLRREADKKQDSEGTYRLDMDRSISSPTPQPLELDDSDDDDFDEGADRRTKQLPPAAEVMPDELDLRDALEGLAEQEKSKPSRRRKKTTRPPTRKRRA